MHKFWLCLFLFIAACSSQGPEKAGTQGASGEGAGKLPRAAVSKTESMYSLEISPQNAFRDTVFYAIPSNFNLSDGQIEWTVNGASVAGAAAPQFKASEVKKRDVIQASVTVAGVKVASNPVEIRNSPPEITSVKIMPEVFKPGDTLYAEVAARDPDGDPVTISYAWVLNGQPAGTDQKLAVSLKRGDKISIGATPFDGVDQGKPVLEEREILNMPPMIMEHREFTFDGKTYTYQVKAEDPDGDPLTYSLGAAPNGMTIDSSTGLVKWTVPPDYKGVTSMAVIVDDGHGGTSRYNVKITIK